MPPKPKRKPAFSRSSPRNKKPTPVKPSALPTVAEEREEDPATAAEIFTAPAVDNEEVPMAKEEIALKVEDEEKEKVVDPVEVETMEEEDDDTEGVDVEENVTEVEPVANEEKEGEQEEEEEEEQEEEEIPEDEEEQEEGDEQTVLKKTGEGEVESISGDDEEHDEDDQAMYMQSPQMERKKQKEFEIYVGGLDKEAVDDDLIEVFGKFGEIQSVRIVKNPLTQKSKGFAFIRYANIEHAKNALAELKDGIKVKGKKIRVSASQDNDTLYLGNVCRTWTRDQVLETLKGYGVDQIEDMLLPDDMKNEGNIKGFAFIEFKSHSAAMAAFQRLRKPDAVFGRNVSAKVAFSQAPLHPCEEDLLKVKTVYLEGIPKSWDEAKVEGLCKQYGEIEKIQLSRNFTSSKRKDYGFVEFSSRDCALACVEGINNTQPQEDVNVKANLAKPIYKGRLAKQNRGGYKVEKSVKVTEESGMSNKKKKAKSKAVSDRKETQPNVKILSSKVSAKFHNKSFKEKKSQQMIQPAKGQKRGRKGMDTTFNQQPSKKLRKDNKYGRGRGRSSFGNPRNVYSANSYMRRPTEYAPAPPATSYTAHSYIGSSMSHHHPTSLEAHAGYVPVSNQVRQPYGYDGRRADAYAFQPSSSSAYVEASNVQGSYPGYSNAGYEAGQGSYPYPRSGAYGYQRPYY